jgi:hypothetical protein
MKNGKTQNPTLSGDEYHQDNDIFHHKETIPTLQTSLALAQRCETYVGHLA